MRRRRSPRQQQVALGTISALLASVLDVSKLDSGAVKPAVVECAINEVFDRLRSDYGPVASDKGITLRVDSTAEGGRTDPGTSAVSGRERFRPLPRRGGPICSFERRQAGLRADGENDSRCRGPFSLAQIHPQIRGDCV